jgi:uncharacterized YigZ family protein
LIDEWNTLERGARSTLKVRDSRFIASSCPASSEEKVRSFLMEVKREYHDAAHNPYACRLFDATHIRGRSSEDGEPAGTSGSAILRLLEAERLVNCAVVVTRYFGGTKLGIGGLKRAYTEAAKKVLAVSPRVRGRRMEVIRMTFPFQFVDTIERAIARWGGTVEERRYVSRASLTVSLPVHDVDPFCEECSVLTMGECTVRR